MGFFTYSKGLRCFAAAAFFIFVALPVLWAEEKKEEETFTVRMEGRADGAGFSARREAIIQAQEEVVKAVLQAMAPGADEKLFRPVLQNAASYIANYQVLRFDQLGASVRVEIDAEVREKTLQKDVAALVLPHLQHAPTLLLFMSDYVPEAEPVMGGQTVSSQTLIQELEKQRLEVGVAETLTSHYSREELLKMCDGDIDAAGRYARSSLKDVVVFGKADAMVQENTLDSNIKRYHATVTLHVFRGVDGKKIDAFQATAAVLGTNAKEGAEQAIRDACGKLVYELTTAAVIAALGAEHHSYVMMSVEEPGTRERLDTLVNVLEMDPHVSKVEVTFYSEGLSRLKVEYEGTMTYLVDKLDTFTYVGKILEMRRVIDRDVTARFIEP